MFQFAHRAAPLFQFERTRIMATRRAIRFRRKNRVESKDASSHGRSGQITRDSDVVHPHAAGIDVGNSEHYVAIAPEKSTASQCSDSDVSPVIFGDLARFLKAHGIRSVAMQSTGVLLDSAVRRPGRRGFRSLPRQCPGYEKPARTQERRAGEPMVTKTTYVWTVAELVPSHIRDSHIADVLATTGRTRADARASASTACRSA